MLPLRGNRRYKKKDKLYYEFLTKNGIFRATRNSFVEILAKESKDVSHLLLLLVFT